ncbi:MAG: cbb3-type cytochrome oxidase assembly protein CcoS [Hyphomicrobiaceae bacterium TMED74]|nr:cbb3-type cytochrome oxidase assembly protein CcoS [Filomicrobium sp.]RPG35633.1 MAG: cbb3-type cytochrome oxidase assembly protein CcoS [Hyphomicrobiaceae bacterium TMED74]
MNQLILLIPVALCLGLLGLAAFVWSLKNGQYDDMEGAASRILLDDEDTTDHASDPRK